MENAKYKSKATLFALFLTFTVAIALVALPDANAQGSYRTKKTHAVCGVSPNPVGVGEEVLIWLGITDYLEAVGNGWEGLTVTVTDPDGDTETLGPYRTDSTGVTGDTYVPDKVGTYKFQTHFPAQWFNWSFGSYFDAEIYGDMWYEASDSDEVELTVQADPIASYPSTPLPTEYWTRPIDAQNSDWYTISANWLTTPANSYAPNNDYAPDTSHILWTKELSTGGLTGGSSGSWSYETGDAYEGKWSGSVIINGILYYNRYASGYTQQGVYAVDLRTGEELWFKNNTRVAFGQTYTFIGFNYQGTFSYIWETETTYPYGYYGPSVTNWHSYDCLTGEYMYSMTNMPSSGAMFGASYTIYGDYGEIYIYNIDLTNGWIALWNSSKVVYAGAYSSMSYGSWGSLANTQTTFDATYGYEWNESIPTGLTGSVSAVLEDRVVGCTASGWTSIGDDPIGIWAFSLEEGQVGNLMYNTTWQPPTGDYSISFGSASLEDGVFTLAVKESCQFYGFDLDTGTEIWGPTESQVDLQVYGMSCDIAYGRVFSTGYGGILYCYNATTGEELWEYVAYDPYNEILWSNNWPLQVAFITDGKIYLTHSEHSGNNPLPRGAPFVCIDVETGEKVWEISLRSTSWGGNAIIGDSIIAMFNTYDNRIYALGQGPSATTASIQDDVVTEGDSVLVTGTVTDVSAGTEDSDIALRFPNGVPAVADANMSEWMEYVYLQQSYPTNVTGVEVVVSVLDPNNNCYEVGRTTGDASGFFKLSFVPEVPGEYTVIATFEGSGAYYGSSAETAIYVEEASVVVEPTPSPAPMTDAYVMGFGVAMVIAIVVVGLVIILLLRKR